MELLASWFRANKQTSDDLKITADTELLGSGLLDSFDFLDVIVYIENKTGKKIDLSVADPNEFSLVSGLVATRDRRRRRRTSERQQRKSRFRERDLVSASTKAHRQEFCAKNFSGSRFGSRFYFDSTGTSGRMLAKERCNCRIAGGSVGGAAGGSDQVQLGVDLDFRLVNPHAIAGARDRVGKRGAKFFGHACRREREDPRSATCGRTTRSRACLANSSRAGTNTPTACRRSFAPTTRETTCLPSRSEVCGRARSG